MVGYAIYGVLQYCRLYIGSRRFHDDLDMIFQELQQTIDIKNLDRKFSIQICNFCEDQIVLITIFY